MNESSTIAAIATAPGRGGVAIVRVSGPDSFDIARRLTGKEPRGGRISHVSVREPGESNSCVIDKGILLAFKAPNSYTGEDVVEFQCHGGFVTPSRVLNACFSAGARIAGRGEFTERAFLNGRITLDQAQAVLDLIDARTSRAADVASRLLNTDDATESSGKTLRAIYDKMLDASSTIEHALDVSEDEIGDEFFERVCNGLKGIKNSVSSAIRDLKERRILREGVKVVLAGPPNVGKSSLMNALLKENRAIVSDIPGTTRDTIEEWLDLDGWPVRLSDTAGLRNTADPIEAEGVRRTKELLESADIVLRLTTSVAEAISRNDDLTQNEIIVLTKSDMLSEEEKKMHLSVSAKTGEGLDVLRKAMMRKFEEFSDIEDFSSTPGESERDEKASVLLSANAFVCEAESFLSADRHVRDLVLAGNALRRACELLGTLSGSSYSEDLLTRIFSRFCVGK